MITDEDINRHAQTSIRDSLALAQKIVDYKTSYPNEAEVLKELAGNYVNCVNVLIGLRQARALERIADALERRK